VEEKLGRAGIIDVDLGHARVREIGWRLKKSTKGTPMTDATVRVAFKDGYALMDIADQVAVRLTPAKARELALALLDAASRAEGERKRSGETKEGVCLNF